MLATMNRRQNKGEQVSATTIVLEVTLWDEEKVQALIDKIEHDSRVMTVRVLS